MALTALNRAGYPLGERVARGARAGGKPAVVLLRVDDYPHWSVDTDRFWAFHERLSSERVPYLLAATPFVVTNPLRTDAPARPYNPAEWAQLARAVDVGELEVALHGVTHRTRASRLASEFDGMSLADAREALARAWAFLEREGCRPMAFVPPFNRLPPALWEALPPQCAVLCLGPESLRDAPLVAAAAQYGERRLVWSLPPFYGRAAEILAALERGDWLARAGAVVPITLHWTWELQDGFAAVGRLARALAGHAVRWTPYATAPDADHTLTQRQA
jgi:predicted deacetylase